VATESLQVIHLRSLKKRADSNRKPLILQAKSLSTRSTSLRPANIVNREINPPAKQMRWQSCDLVLELALHVSRAPLFGAMRSDSLISALVARSIAVGC